MANTQTEIPVVDTAVMASNIDTIIAAGEGTTPQPRTSRAKAKDCIPADVVAILKRPLPSKAISVGTRGLSSVKTIYVPERLNEAFGEGRWFTKAEIVERGDPKAVKEPNLIVLKVVLTLLDYPWFYAEAYGGNQNADLGDSYKGAVSDALGKIAANHFGVAADVYKGSGQETSKAYEAAEAAAAVAAAKATPRDIKDAKAVVTAAAVATDQATVAAPPDCQDCLLDPEKVEKKLTKISTYTVKVPKVKGGTEMVEKVYDAADLTKVSQKKYKLDLCATCQGARAAALKAATARVN